MFKKAERKRSYVKIALCGVSGSGKTYSALLMAQGLGEKIAMIDTENGSGELYSDLCEYDVAQIVPPFTTTNYINAIKEAERAGYDVLIIDSLSHVWNGAGGLLEQQEQLARTKYKGNSWAAWKDITPMHDKLVQTILQSKIHVIVTMRSKQDYIQTEDKKIKKVGMAPVQREGLEYEFTIMFDIDREKHEATASKDRTRLFDNTVGAITPETGEAIRQWIDGGAEMSEPDPVVVPVAEPAAKSIEYVKFEDNKCFVQGNHGWQNVEELSVEALKVILSKPQFEKAHSCAQACLDAIEVATGAIE